MFESQNDILTYNYTNSILIEQREVPVFILEF